MGEINNVTNLKDFFDDNEPVGYAARPEILLHPNIPKPLHSLSPRTLLGKTWWDNERKKAYSKHDYHCMACGIYAPWNNVKEVFETEQKLHAHEAYDINYGERTAELVEIVAICPTCHNYIHSGRTQAMYDKGIYDEEDCWYIFTHGNSVLIDASISPFKKKVDSRTYEKEWGDWRLIINKKKYKSKFKSYKEFLEKG